MPSEPVLSVRGLCKNFKLYQRPRDRLLELFGRARHRLFPALADISFALARGEAVGIIGENGSGKSTLLKIIAGILMPDAGEIKLRGSAAGLLELGAGFNSELSGRRNIYLNGLYLHLDKRFLRKYEEQIIEFAELEQFIDEPLRSYSSGMVMRLGFAIAMHAMPQCFIIDEALAVGDARFQQKCFASLNAFRQNGGGILFVSHDLNAVRLFCDRAMLLADGRIRYLGKPETAVNEFYELLAARGKSGASTSMGYGNGDARFVRAEARDCSGKQRKSFVSGEAAHIHFAWRIKKPLPAVTFGMTLRDRFGQDIFGTNSAMLGKTAALNSDGEGCFTLEQLNLAPGAYSVSLSAHTGMTHLENCFHWWDNAITLEILENPERRFGGIVRLDAKLELMR